MAITLTIAELLAALRLTDTPEELAEATRLHALASEITTTTAPHAPDVVQNECVVRLSAFLYDMPNAAPGDSYANAWRASGAGRLALPYIIHRAGLVGGEAVEAAQDAMGTLGNPVTGLSVSGDTLTVTFADNTTVDLDFPTVDQVARDSATAAQDNLDDHEANHPSGGGGVDQTARDAAAAAAGDVVTHNAAGDAHQDIRTAIDGRVNLAQVEETAQRLIDSAGHATNVDLGVAQVAIQANANELTLHEATPHGGGMGGDTPTPTPPVTLVDGELYTAHGDLTIPGWRGYDFFQMFHTNAGTTYSTVAISVAQLIASSPFAVPFGRNVALMLAVSTTDNDMVTTSATTGNGVPVPTATSTMTVMAWFAGTVVDGGGGGGDGTDQTARDSAAEAQVAADTAQSEIDTHELSAHNTDATARASAATNATNLTAHEATPHGGGGGGLPLALQATSTSAVALVSAPQLIPGMTLPASNFTAGDTWRITATCFFSGIGDAAHAVAVRILQGAAVEHFGYETQIDGDSASKFELTVDRVITIANPPAAISIHAEEDSGNVLTQGSTLIAMHVRTS